MKTQVIFMILAVALSFASCNKHKKRTTIDLNGEWKIEEGSMDIIPESFTHTVRVPGLVSLAVPLFKDAGPKVKDRRSLIQTDSLREAFWYYRTFKINAPIPAIASLKISKAMFGTRVYLNGKYIGEHLPCFTPGYFNVKDALKEGDNELIVRIGSSRNSVPFSIPDGFDFEKDRYIPGIFDNVELVLCETPHIVNAQTAPDILNKQIRVRVKLDNPGKNGNTKVNFSVTEAKSHKSSGQLVADFYFLSGNENENYLDVSIPLSNCRFWSPEDPFLYNLSIKTEGDEYLTRFGMREFHYDTINGKPILNGKPYFLRGTNVTLYRFFEDETCQDLPWNSEWVRNLHKSFSRFHWNSLRYCIGIAPDEWYNIADEEGLLIQNEFPIWYGKEGWCKWPEELKNDELKKEFKEWVEDQWNHPSIVIWDASNETLSHEGKTEEIAEAIKYVRSMDLSNRPWDNSYSDIRMAGDVMELHPYHFINPNFRLRDIATARTSPGGKPGDIKFMKIINEYGWLWLNRDGSTTTLTNDLYRNLLGNNSTEAGRRHLYATYLAAETEFWRCHRQTAGVMHFTSLGYSRADGQTSDHFIDVANLKYDDEFLKYIPDAFAPVGIMLDEWGDEIEPDTYHDFKINVINDLEPEWHGRVTLEIYNQGTLISGQAVDMSIPPFGQNNTTFRLVTPEFPGMFTVVASLIRENETPVRSIREIPFRKKNK